MVIYLFFINLIGLLIMKYDKTQSKWPGARRIPEKTLLIISLVGGAAGVFLGMKIFRHKTRHAVFYIGVPLILIAQTTILLLQLKPYILYLLT